MRGSRVPSAAARPLIPWRPAIWPLAGHRLFHVYVGSIIAAGAGATVFALGTLIRFPPSTDYYFLATLTLASSLVPVKLPNVAANISVSETFIFAATVMHGPAAGTTLVFIDALLIWIRLANQGSKWYRAIFSLSAPPLAIWISASLLFAVTGTPPLAQLGPAARPDIWHFGLGLFGCTFVYFLLNTWMIAVAIALERQVNAIEVWRRSFSSLWLNYLAAGSIAVLLVHNTDQLSPGFLLFVMPLVLILFFSYRWLMDRVAQAERHVAEMNRTFLQTVEALALAIDAKDQVTHGHIRRVQHYTMELARELHIADPRLLDAIRAAALLHDTGKLAVPEYVLNKPGPLTPAEYARMKTHATIGADILKSIDFPYPVEPIVRHHHEKWDGTGYPSGLKAEHIPIGARILSVVDVYDALTSDRPYRPRMSRADALAILQNGRGSAFDPDVVDGFARLLDRPDGEPAAAAPGGESGAAARSATPQHDAIRATALEEKFLTELRRDLTRAAGSGLAVLLHDRLADVMPHDALVLYTPAPAGDVLRVAGTAGPRAVDYANLVIPFGERVSGWAFAHRQTMLNADAALERLPEMRPPEAREYAAAIPITAGDGCAAVLGVYRSTHFTIQDQHLLESLASLLRPALSDAAAS